MTLDKYFSPAEFLVLQSDMNAHGTLFLRKRRGRKRNFMIGGPTLDQAQSYVRWETVKAEGLVVEFHGDVLCSLVPLNS